MGVAESETGALASALLRQRGSESRVGYLRPQGYIKIVKYSHFQA